MFQDIEDWERSRLGKFTSSEIYKLLQEGKAKGDRFSKTGMAYIREKVTEILTGEKVKELSGINSIEWGNAHEYEAIKMYQELTLQEEVKYYGGAYPEYFPFNKYSGGSPDAETDTVCIEAKCPYNSQIHIENLIGSLDDNPQTWMKKERFEHYCQLQFNMLIRGKLKGHYISYDPRMVEVFHRLALIEVSPDKEIIDKINFKLLEAAVIAKDILTKLNANPYGQRAQSNSH